MLTVFHLSFIVSFFGFVTCPCWVLIVNFKNSSNMQALMIPNNLKHSGFDSIQSTRPSSLPVWLLLDVPIASQTIAPPPIQTNCKLDSAREMYLTWNRSVPQCTSDVKPMCTRNFPGLRAIRSNCTQLYRHQIGARRNFSISSLRLNSHQIPHSSLITWTMNI